jgi:hypothetical protein
VHVHAITAAAAAAAIALASIRFSGSTTSTAHIDNAIPGSVNQYSNPLVINGWLFKLGNLFGGRTAEQRSALLVSLTCTDVQ